MEFNYALEKKKFDKNWMKLRKEYKEAGMSDESIQKIWEFDYEQFKKQRTFCIHNQYFDARIDGNEISDEAINPLLLQYEDSFIVPAKEVDTDKRMSWMELIDNPELYDTVHKMKPEDIELLTLLAFEGFSQKEIADHYGISKAAISQRIARIKNILKKFQKTLNF